MKKIVILNGAGKKNGNTAALIEAFKTGAKESGNEVKEFYLHSMNIKGCLDCQGCARKPTGDPQPCVQKDDMQAIYPLVQEADMIVFASPIYYFTLSAQLEAVIQRFYAINHPAKAKYSALLLSSYSPDVYNGAIGQYKDMIAYMGMTDKGIIMADNTTNKTPAKLAEVRALGASL